VITEQEYKLATQGAMSAWRSGRNLVEKDDLIQEARVWMLEHPDKLETWREQGRHGANKLRHACRQACLTVLAKERRRRSGLQAGDVFYYTPVMVKEVLSNIFHIDDWSNAPTMSDQEVKSAARPSEGNNRLAMIVDVRSAYFSLPQNDRNLLSDLYENGGMPHDVAAATWGVTERTIRRREERIIDKMVERLGGEPPWVR
jgi:DNA-directed RNA polymerase specialized sigma24 family protein